MKLRTVSTETELLALRERWEGLLAVSSANTLPLSFDWICAYWSVFGAYSSLAIACIYDEEELVALVPLVRHEEKYRGVRTRVAVLMTNMHTPFSNVIFHSRLSEREREAVLECVLDSCQDDILRLTCVPEGEDLRRACSQVAERLGRLIGFLPNLVTPVVRAESDWETFLLGRSKKFRRGLRNKLNRFERAGLIVRMIEVGESVEEYLDQIVTVSSRSWKKSKGTDLGSSRDARRFVRQILERFGKHAATHLWIAYDQDRPIAYELHIVHENRVYPIRADFDEDYRQHSPGSVVEYEALKGVFDNDYADVYFSCADDYRYLGHWTDERARFCDIEIFSTSFKARFLHWLEYRLIPVTRVIRHRLGLWRRAE